MQYDNNNTIIVGGSPTSWMTYDDNTEVSDNLKATVNALKKTSIEKSKRKQVKNACVNCQKACKKCDDGRPCKRCVKLGLTSTCRDSDRKERKKGVKRGPYKKRQAYIKDKPVYPKLTEENWTTPIYERVPQVLSHSNNQSIYTDFYDESYCVPSQSGSSLSPVSSSSFVDESDETLHHAYGYGYTNNTITTSPSATSMLDHQTISGNVTPLQDSSYSWDDIENYSPIGSNPIMMNQFPTTAIYQQKDITNSFNDFTLLQQLPANNNYWYTNDMPIDYQPQPQQNYFEYSIPPQYNTWSYSN
ncbi:hypothetical protein INT47_007269 [Mucor saturninus]|uniref:Zn(2)-C6 fungal-type domain-containing protein n=1 Tax=Mucor saturninus TaxID=64648 RepID=A0A8H7V153_9FUNG|nr:hypothetical protein INT47_007269 [Mucor saturninus]